MMFSAGERSGEPLALKKYLRPCASFHARTGLLLLVPWLVS